MHPARAAAVPASDASEIICKNRRRSHIPLFIWHLLMCGVALVKDGCDPSKRMSVTVRKEEMRLLCALKQLATVILDHQRGQSAKRQDLKR